MKLLFNWNSKDLSPEIMTIHIAKIQPFFLSLLFLIKSLINHSNLQFAPLQRKKAKNKNSCWREERRCCHDQESNYGENCRACLCEEFS